MPVLIVPRDAPWTGHGPPHGARYGGGMAAGSASTVSGPVTNPHASNKMDLKEWKWADPGIVRRFDNFIFPFLLRLSHDIPREWGGFGSVYELVGGNQVITAQGNNGKERQTNGSRARSKNGGTRKRGETQSMATDRFPVRLVCFNTFSHCT
jgi:hypothetical protein